jgi:hypothetical protein
MTTNPKKTVKNSLTLVVALFGCGMTLATIAPVYALSKSSVTQTPTPSSSLISKQTTPATTTQSGTTGCFPVFTGVVSKYSPEQRKRLLNILNSEEAKNTNSVEELGKLIGDDNLAIAIQKDVSKSNSAQVNRVNWPRFLHGLSEAISALFEN